MGKSQLQLTELWTKCIIAVGATIIVTPIGITVTGAMATGAMATAPTMDTRRLTTVTITTATVDTGMVTATTTGGLVSRSDSLFRCPATARAAGSAAPI